jgi:TRAP-type C4-dicarboxylate transport system substrate-binding protein
MNRLLSRRSLGISVLTTAVVSAAHMRVASATEPLLLRCALETAPTHKRNAVIRDYLANIGSASGGKIQAQLFESGQLFPDLQVGKALLQGQIDMADAAILAAFIGRKQRLSLRTDCAAPRASC